MEDSENRQERDHRAGVIGSVAKALELLQIFARGEDIHVNSAARELGASRSTVHRLLATLTAYGYAEQDPMSRAYRPGPALTGVGLAAVESGGLRTMTNKLLKRLAEATNETAHLMILQGDHVLCIDSVESSQAVRTGSRTGWKLRAQSASAGKALLAELSEAEVAAIFPQEMIFGSSWMPPLRRVDLLAELELVRARGYATNYGESEPDVSAVGVVVRDDNGQARAGISITAPRSRGNEAWMRATGLLALEIVEEFRGRIA